MPAPASVDAWTRAFRTFAWNLFITVVATVAVGMTAALGDLRWTGDYWTALGLKLAADVLTAVVAYIARLVIPPPIT
jgi:hypothetical protein